MRLGLQVAAPTARAARVLARFCYRHGGGYLGRSCDRRGRTGDALDDPIKNLEKEGALRIDRTAALLRGG